MARLALLVLGILQFQAIDFFFPPRILQDFSGYTLLLTIAIVLSGQYKDDLDNCDDIVYTSQGGNNLLSNKRQVRDQGMLHGNLVLKVCIYKFLLFGCFSSCFLCFVLMFIRPYAVCNFFQLKVL